jgi:hypothetical protein
MLPIYDSFSENFMMTPIWMISLPHDAAWKAYNRGAWGPGGRTQLRFEGPRIPAHPWLKLALRLTTAFQYSDSSFIARNRSLG